MFLCGSDMSTFCDSCGSEVKHKKPNRTTLNMPKRKRGEPSLEDKLEKQCNEVFRALKSAKGFERQRLSKRLREDGIGPDKKERLEREVTVLKVTTSWLFFVAAG